VTKYLQTLALGFVLAAASTGFVRAQQAEKPAAPARAKSEVPVPLKIQVVLSRYQGEKKISSMPYTLAANAGDRANLRMGASIPVMTAAAPSADGKNNPFGSFTYKDVGTNIDCQTGALDDGRFRITITIDDASVYTDEQVTTSAAVKGNPSFRQFRAVDSMVLKDGQTGQFTTAADKVSGETIKVDVTLTVVR
jgi:hypothetical protein